MLKILSAKKYLEIVREVLKGFLTFATFVFASRIKSAEFLLLLVGNFLPSTKFTHSLEYEEERGEGLQMESLQDDIMEVLGEEIASLLWAVGQLGSFDSQKKQPSLQFQAQHVVDSLDSQLR